MWQKNYYVWYWNCIMWRWNCQMWEKKKRGTTECDKRTITYDVGTTQCKNETVKCEEKSKRTTKYEKRTVTCDVGIAQCEDGTVKSEKKVRGLLNVTKELSHVLLELHNSSFVTTQCEDKTIKCEKKVTWYSRFPNSSYRTPHFFGGTVELPFLFVGLLLFPQMIRNFIKMS